MNTLRSVCAMALLAAAIPALQAATAASTGFDRTDLLLHDMPEIGRQVLQTRFDIGPGAASPEHRHPGVEIAHVLQGTLEYRLEGQAPVTLKAGDSLFIPAGIFHIARNVGSGTASELATYILEPGKPTLELASHGR